MEIATTARLRLRTITLGDAAFYLELVTDPAFVEHIGDRGIRSVEQARRALAVGPMAMQQVHGHSIYLVELKDSGRPIGMSGLIKRDILEDVDIGYAFLPEWRGCGYAFEAGAAVLAYAPTIGLTRVLAITSPDNAASNRLLRKLGLRFCYFTHLTPDGAGSNLYQIEFGPAASRSREGGNPC
jgi:RimJ/RimL family protein N-acetyltransferase